VNVKKIATAPARGAKALGRMIFRRYPWRMWRFGSQYMDYGQVGDGTGSSTVMIVVQWIARTFPEAPPALWKIGGDGQEEQDPKHDLLQLLKWPNPYYTGSTLWQATLVDWIVSGESYWLKVRDRGARVTELWWVPAMTIEPQGTEDDFITQYVYKPGDGQQVVLDPSDLVHFRYGLDPDDPKHGWSPLKAVLREVYTDDEAAVFSASLLRNSGVPGLLVSPEGDIAPSADDVDATKAYVQEAFTGSRRGEPLVFSGPTKVQQFGFNPSQLALKDLRRIPEERVSAVLGVPAIACGLGAGLDRSTFANFAEAREAAYESNIIPAQRLLAEQMQLQLLVDFEPNMMDWRVGFDLSGVRVLQEDMNALANRYDVGIRGGWVKVAEGRRAMDLDVDDTHEIFLRPSSVYETTGEELQPTPADRAQAAAEAAAARPDPTPPGEEPPPEQPKRVGFVGTKLAGDQTPRMLPVIHSLENDIPRLAALFEDELTADFAELGTLAAEAYLTLIGPDGKLNGNGNGHSEKLLGLDTLAARVAYALGLDSWRERKLTARLTQHYKRTARRTAKTIGDTLGIQVHLTDHDLEEIGIQGANRRLLMDIRGQTRKALLNALEVASQEGKTGDEVAALIRKTVPAGGFNGGASQRAQGIAYNETLVAQRLGTLLAYKASGQVSHVVAFDGTEHDEDCANRNGRTFTLSDAQDEGEHPNGVLAWGPVTGDRVAV
jgi:HK97 family phage portal protein